MTVWLLFIIYHGWAPTLLNSGEYPTYAKCSAAGQVVVEDLKSGNRWYEPPRYRCVKVTK